MANSRIQEEFDRVLADFPSADMWVYQTDGWQFTLGPSNFRDVYYKGMNQGFNYIRDHWEDPITPKMLEDLYHCAYKNENDYTEDPVFQSGIRNNNAGIFEVAMSLPGAENNAGVSEDGLEEFADNVIEAYKDRSKNGFPRWALKVSIGNENPPIYVAIDDIYMRGLNCELFKSDDKQRLIEFLRIHLTNAALTKNDCPERDNHTIQDTGVEILCTNSYGKADINNFINKKIVKFESEISQSQDDKNKLIAIADFIRSLHQSHPFPDGNGRTLIFLLGNLLLMKHMRSLMITQTPAHFGGFSKEELANELQDGISKFKEYGIKPLVLYLKDLTDKDIVNKNVSVKSGIEKLLSKNPAIALSQINELFVRIEKNILKVPQNYWGSSYNIRFLNQLSSGFNNDNMSHDLVLSHLKQLYYENFVKLKDSAQIKPDCLMDIMSKHAILNDHHYTYEGQYQEMDLLAEVTHSLGSTHTSSKFL